MKAAVLLAAALMSACTNERLTRRFERLLPPAPVEGLLELRASDQAVSSTPPKARGMDLAPEAQAALVAGLLGAGAKANDIVKELAAERDMREGAEPYADSTRVKRRLVLTVGYPAEAWRARGADRIDWLQLKVTLPPDGRVRFVSWDKLATEHRTVDLGTVDWTSSGEFTAEVAPQGGGFKGGTIGATLSRELSESVPLKQDVVRLTGSLASGEAVLVQEGAPDRDLSGNTIFDVDLQFDDGETMIVQRIGSLQQAGADVAPDKVFITSATVRRPDLSCPIRVGVSATYAIRTVSAGQRTRGEYDDVVTMKNGTSKTAFSLAADLAPDTYVLQTAGNPTVRRLSWKSSDAANPVELRFESRAAATMFLDWLLRKREAKLANGTLWFRSEESPAGGALNPIQATALVVHSLKDDPRRSCPISGDAPKPSPPSADTPTG